MWSACFVLRDVLWEYAVHHTALINSKRESRPKLDTSQHKIYITGSVTETNFDLDCSHFISQEESDTETNFNIRLLTLSTCILFFPLTHALTHGFF